jgi:hypothetical protein
MNAAAKQGEASYLAQSAEEAKQQLLQSGRYLIDTSDADIGAAKGQGLRNKVAKPLSQ